LMGRRRLGADQQAAAGGASAGDRLLDPVGKNRPSTSLFQWRLKLFPALLCRGGPRRRRGGRGGFSTARWAGTPAKKNKKKSSGGTGQQARSGPRSAGGAPDHAESGFSTSASRWVIRAPPPCLRLARHPEPPTTGPGRPMLPASGTLARLILRGLHFESLPWTGGSEKKAIPNKRFPPWGKMNACPTARYRSLIVYSRNRN